MLHIRGEVTHGREAESGHDWIRDQVDIFVNAARHEAAVEMDGTVTQCQLAVDHRGKLPLRARDDSALALAGVADGERVTGIVRLCDRVLRASDCSADHVAE